MREDSLLNTDPDPDWSRNWKMAGMPVYVQKDLQPVQSITVHFATLQDREEFVKLIDPELTPGSKFTWFPAVDYNKWSDRKQVQCPNGKYPIYVISKGRWESRLTVKYLELLGLDFKLVIEPQEFDQYAKVVSAKKILTLPFANLGQGSIPARNWVWEHSIKRGHKRHWILDDNIQGFYCMNHNRKALVDFNPFICVEQFTDKFSNIGISGMNYEFFLQRRSAVAAYYLNTRVYSCILINNAMKLEERWRGRYNEDTDLSLRTLKAGWCTVLFNYVQAKKVPTMTMKGGNTDELYRTDDDFDGRLEMAKSLKEQHPEIVSISRKWGRWQHHVDYRSFKRLKLIPADNRKTK